MHPAQTLFPKKIIGHFLQFIKDSRTVGILLLFCTAVSLCLANSSFSIGYLQLLAVEVPLPNALPLHLPHSLLHWINDGLMAVFFFLAGMEIKREIMYGELSSFSQAILPLVAAIGGMLLPALIFFSINKGGAFSNGWGIPMATDIAFSLGIAALLGKKVPLGLKIFLTALAIIDDLGTILAIALFYSAHISWIYLGFAAFIIAALYGLLRFKIFGWFNFLLGFLLWYCFLNSGIHATIAGVIFAFFIPVEQLHRLEKFLSRPVNLFIIPIFALANTAIVLPGNISTAINNGLGWGIMAGLFIGKPLGISAAAFMAVKLKWARLPANTSWHQLFGVAVLAGIGFTMSIFIATIAFNKNATVDSAKIAVLVASLAAILIGFVWIKYFTND